MGLPPDDGNARRYDARRALAQHRSMVIGEADRFVSVTEVGVHFAYGAVVGDGIGLASPGEGIVSPKTRHPMRANGMELCLEDYFSGRCKAWGVFQDRFGKLRRQFEVDISGTWHAETQTLSLVEDFQYLDGQEESRVWTIVKQGENSYSGRTDGVKGTADGTVLGNSLHWRYHFALPVHGRTWVVHFDDWLFLLSDGLLINRATVTKFRILIGHVTIVFHRLS